MQEAAPTAVPKRKAASPSVPAMAPLAALPRAGAAQGGRGDLSLDDGSPAAGGGRGSKIIKVVSYDESDDSDFI